MKTAVFTFGRFNPPTVGHVKLITKVQKTARSVGGDSFIFASPSHDRKKNPLTYNSKIKLLSKIARKSNVINNNGVRTPFHALAYLSKLNYDIVYMVVGSDRVKEFERNIPKYIGTDDYKNIKKFVVVSAGDRDPDAEGISGMSASKMRQAVVDNNLNTFQSGMPTMISKREVQRVFQEIKRNMNIREWVDMDELYMFIEENADLFADINTLFEADDEKTAKKKTTSTDDKGATWNDVSIVKLTSGASSGKYELIWNGKYDSDKHELVAGSPNEHEKKGLASVEKYNSMWKQGAEFIETSTSRKLVDKLKNGSSEEESKSSQDNKDQQVQQVSTIPIRRKSEQYTEYEPNVPHYQQKGRQLRPRNASKIAQMYDELPIIPDKQGRGVKYEWALCLAGQLAAGHSIEDIKSRHENEGGLLGADRDTFALAVATLEHIPEDERGYIVHSDELDITGDPEPKTDICIMNPDGTVKRKLSVKLDGDVQLASGQGKFSAKAIELAAQKTLELDPSFDTKAAKVLVEEVKKMPTRLMSASNAEKFMSINADKPEKLKEFFTDITDPTSIRPELNSDIYKENIKPKLLAVAAEVLDGSETFKQVLTHEAMTGYYSFTESDNPMAIADGMISPMGMDIIDVGNPLQDQVTAKYADKAKMDFRAKSRSKVGSYTQRTGVAQPTFLKKNSKTKKFEWTPVGKKTMSSSEFGKAAMDVMSSEAMNHNFSVLVEDSDNLITAKEDVQKELSDNAHTYASEGLTNLVDIKLSLNVTGKEPENIQKNNIIRIGGKEISIPVEENVNNEFAALLEVQDRADEEDTKAAQKRERSNQKTRRTKEQHQKSSNVGAALKSSPVDSVNPPFEPELQEPVKATSRTGEWVGLEPDMKIERALEIKDSLYELLADEEMAEKLDPNDKFVKDWYAKTRPFYDAYNEDEKSVTMYSTASDVKDIINNWEKLDQQYNKIAGKIKKTPVKNTTQHVRDFDPPKEPEEEAVPPAPEGNVDEAFSNLIEKNAKIEMALPEYPYQREVFDTDLFDDTLGREYGWELGDPPRPVKVKSKANEDCGAGFVGTSDYVRKLFKDTPGADEPEFLKKQKKGESQETKRSKGTANRV
jgi:nicotinic acid mononucleotide adenylyltransferase